MAALAIAKSKGLRVGTTTRNPTKVNELIKEGADWDWNEIKINGVSTAKYTKKGDVPLSGSICLQAHSGGTLRSLVHGHQAETIKIRSK
jgi:hypothetical protein